MLQRPNAREPGIATVAQLAAAVQDNCDVADARHARELGMCVYLLGMREYFRWMSDYPLGMAPPSERVREWITCQESRWDTVFDDMDAFAGIPFPDGDLVDAFDEAEVNRRIGAMGLPERLLYGAGLGRFSVPIFFLAETVREEIRDGIRVTIVDREWARGFSAPPATSRNGAIQIRRDAFRRWLWTRAEQHGLRLDGATVAPAVPGHGGRVDNAARPDHIERIVERETETLILHELGEIRAGGVLGPDWERMLAQVDDRRTEVILRAVRDLLADCLVTLPELVARQAGESLAFWRSNFDGMRKTLAPELGTTGGPDGIRLDAIRGAADAGTDRWEACARALLASWRDAGPDGVIGAARALVPN